MKYSEYLSTMAQVAGVLVGFANLANAISRPGMTVDELKLNKLRIILTTEMGIVLICICILPLLLTAADFAEATIFRTLSVAVAIFAVPYSIYMPIRVKKWSGKMFPTGLAKYYHTTNILLMTGPLVLNAFGVFGNNQAVLVYCMVTFILFTLVCTLLCRLLNTVLPTFINE